MAISVKAIVWHKDTAKDRPEHWQTTMEELGPAVAKGLELVDTLEAPETEEEPSGELYVFAAPEYLFRPTSHDDAFSEADKAVINQKLLEICIKHKGKNLLFAPGSVCWKGDVASQSPGAKLASIKAALEAKKGRYQVKRRQDLDIAKIQERPSHLLFAAESARKEVTHLAYNQALVYYKGALRKTVTKSAPGGDFGYSSSTTSAERTGSGLVRVPGTGAGTFSLENLGLKVGVAICADGGRMKDVYGRDVDLYVLLSASVPLFLVPKGTVRSKGLALNAAAMKQMCGIETAESVDASDDKTPRGLTREWKEESFLLGRAVIPARGRTQPKEDH